MTEYFIFYHIFFETNWDEIVSEQLMRLHNSGLLAKSQLQIGIVYGHNINKDVNLEKLDSILKNYYNYKIIFTKPTGCCGESDTLYALSEFCLESDDNIKILYIHTKGITQHKTIRETPVAEWRRMMEYFLIDNWANCVSKLDDGYDCCGINYQNHSANIKSNIICIKIYNGNFFWVNSNYIKKLDNTILFEHRYSAENWIFSSEEHNAYSFLDVPSSFDLYYNIYEKYKN